MAGVVYKYNMVITLVGVQALDNLKNILSLKKGDKVIAKHTPLSVGGKDYPLCVSVFHNEKKIGVFPEPKTPAPNNIFLLNQKKVAEKKEVEGVVSHLLFRAVSEPFREVIREAKKGDPHALNFVQNEIKKDELVLENPADDQSHPLPISVSVDFPTITHLDPARFREKDGVAYTRITTLLDEYTDLISTQTEQMILERYKASWGKNKEKDLEKYNKKVAVYKSIIRDLFGFVAYVKDNHQVLADRDETFTAENTIDYEFGEMGKEYLMCFAEYGKLIHSWTYKMLECISLLKPENYPNVLRVNFVLNQLQPSQVLTEEDEGVDTVLFDEELKASGQYDFKAYSGVLKKPVIVDIKSGKLRVKHLLQVAFYGKNAGYEKAAILSWEDQRVLYVDVEEWYGYLMKIVKDKVHLSTLVDLKNVI